MGGDFSPGTLLAAYRKGMFPWPMSATLVPWCSPDPRAIYPLGPVPEWSRSLRRTLRRKPFRVTVDTDFAGVLEGCADREGGTWITSELADGYKTLHAMGWAHSIEVWNRDTGALAGGIYGVSLGALFAGESMFHRETDASKVAFAVLVARLRPAGFRIFDVQVMSPHLHSLGCIEVPRKEFLKSAAEATREPCEFPTAEVVTSTRAAGGGEGDGGEADAPDESGESDETA